MKFSNIRNILFYTILFAFLLTVVSGQEKENMSVLPFLANNVPTYLPLVVGKIIEDSIIKTSAFNVIPQSGLKSLLGEKYSDYLKCTDLVCALKIGEKLSAKQIIVGTVSLLDGKYLIDSLIIDVVTAKVIYSESSEVENIKDLSAACENLALSLSRNANPELVIEIPNSERRSHVDAMAMKMPVKEPVKEEAEKEPEKEADKQTVKDSSSDINTISNKEVEVGKNKIIDNKNEKTSNNNSLNIPAYLLFTTGILSQTTGNIVQNIAFQYQLAAIDSYSDYMAAGAESGDIYTNYLALNKNYTNSTYLHYSLWAGGGIVPAISSAFLGNSSLSAAGNIMFASSIILNTMGNMANAISVIQNLKMRNSYAKYMADNGSGTADLFAQYTADYKLYSIENLVGYGLWAGGTLFAVSSYLMPGRRTFTNPTFFESLLSGLGYIMFSAGNYSFSMGTNMLLAADGSYADYMDADEFSAAALYSVYEAKIKNYKLFSYTSYGLWGGGALLLISSLFVPDRVVSNNVAEAPYDISIRPAMLGLGVNVGIQWK